MGFSLYRVLTQPLASLLVSSAVFAQTDFPGVSPVLQARCVVCHSGPAAPFGLRLDSREAILAEEEIALIEQ